MGRENIAKKCREGGLLEFYVYRNFSWAKREIIDCCSRKEMIVFGSSIMKTGRN